MNCNEMEYKANEVDCVGQMAVQGDKNAQTNSKLTSTADAGWSHVVDTLA
jgi:hypothetical protein